MNRNGFTLIEIMIGMLILVMGVMTLVSSTSYVGMQLQAADVRTERGVAYQQAMEQLYAAEFDDVTTRVKGGAEVIGDYSVWWDVSSVRWALKEVRMYSEGPGFTNGKRSAAVEDTMVVRIARPVK